MLVQVSAIEHEWEELPVSDFGLKHLKQGGLETLNQSAARGDS